MSESDVQEFLIALSVAGVRHVVVGAYALAAHGYVRSTGDIDVLVEATPTNARRLADAVRAFAAVSLEYFQLTVDDLSRPGEGFYMGVEPDRIDVLTRIVGVGFARAWKDRVLLNIAGVPDVPTMGLESLIAAKRASATRREPGSTKALQDRSDLAWLLAERERRRR
ncbi:hypothetical protein [Nannocystis pusilla]|uniref:Nucleotidyltransferase family protein n=1 Tax=Nannocystis pusilla TaxID=889268 RepID=A0ABS7U3I2_9BACT|nr:hypothetical protein [Nannocystis pusilla]MBZ5715088.1 hypothetical protein [Nannocystis pusilla]